MESWRISNTMWFPEISSPFPTAFPYNSSRYGHQHLCSTDGKREEPAPGQVEGPGCWQGKNTDLKLTSQLPGTRNWGESKHQIWDFNNMSIYFNDLKAEPAGLVTVSKRYGERNDEAWIFILTATTGELRIFAHSGPRQGRISVPCAHTITQDRQPPAGQQVSSEHWAQSFTPAISNSLREVLLTDYFKTHQFSCYNHPSEKMKSNRRTKLGSVSNGKRAENYATKKLFLSHILLKVFSLCCVYLPHLWIMIPSQQIILKYSEETTK